MHNPNGLSPRIEKTMSHQDEQAIAKDLALCDLVAAIGSKAAKRQAKAQRKACFAQIRQWNTTGGVQGMTDAQLLAELLSIPS